MALPRGFRFTSPLASDERRERNAQGRNCLKGSSGRAKMKPAKPVPSLSRYSSMALPEPAGRDSRPPLAGKLSRNFLLLKIGKQFYFK